MKEKTRKIFIMIVMAALIVSLMAASFAALTYGRYAGGRRDENSPYDDFIDFVGATAFTVQTPEELTNAIENGYSYIEIGDKAENPFVVNDDIANVTTNLVLDVNGTTVIRNSRNPLLDVKRSVSVVLVYDSSKEQKGGFYNPVGSALQTSGGTLTVGAGVYESGPNIQASSFVTEEEIKDVFVRDGERDLAKAYKRADSAVQLPKLTRDVYLESEVEEGYLRNDTYLLYTQESNCYEKSGKLYVDCETEGTDTGTGESGTVTGTEFSVECNVASCDFYYYYPVGTANEDGFYTYAVVYGYHDVKALAEDCTDTSTDTSTDTGTDTSTDLSKKGLVWPYAAIRSEAGNTHARGGEFKTHFGEENTYSIYSEGGEMTVGTDSANSAPSFTATGAGVCIRMTEGENNTLTISSGSFSSETGDTIKMSGGTMTVTRGSFTKSGGKGIGSGDNAQITNQTAIIDIQGGTLTINGAAANSVTLTAGSADTDNGGTLENVFGILARGGEVSVGGCTLNIYGDYSAGVLSYDGTINLGDNTVIDVRQSETATVLTSAGVSSEQASEGEEHPVNLLGNVTITSNGLGITARGTVNVKKETSTVTTYRGSTVTTSRGTGIYVNNGSFNVFDNAAITVNSTVQSGYSWATPPETETTNSPGTDSTNPPNIYNGVYVHGGSLISNGTLNVTFKGVASDETKGSEAYLNHQIKSHAVRVEGDDSTRVTIASGTILNGTRDTNGTVIAGSGIGGGILVNGGTVTLGKQETTNGVTTYSGPTVQTTGTENYDFNNTDFEGNWNYKVTETGGDAVKVANGNLTIYGGEYTSKQGNGILVQQNETGTSYQAEVYGGTFSGDDVYSSNTGNDSFYTGPGASYAFKVLGGTLTIYDGIFTSNDGGAFVMNGEATMYGGIIAAQGATAFVTYTNATVTFDPTTELTVDGVPSTGRTLYVSGASSGLTVEETSGTAQEITINGGTFTGGTYSFTAEGQEYYVQGSGSSRNGIWYGNGGANLKITDGTFQGDNRSGLWLNVRVYDNGNVHLTGGTYYGNPVRSGTIGRYYWNNGGISAQSNGRWDGNGYRIGVNYILDDGYMARCYYDGSYHNEYDTSALNQTTSRSEHVIIQQR